MRRSFTVLLIIAVLLIIGSVGAAAYYGTFYVTGSQFYEACWERRAKEKLVGNFNEAEATNSTQAALWASCGRIAGESMDRAGFTFGSSAKEAPTEAKALAGPCPDWYTEAPVRQERFYSVVVDAVEQNGGPSLIDRIAPADWLIQRTLKARWPHCIDAARPYLAKARNSN
jgi:hypothetical protein